MQQVPFTTIPKYTTTFGTAQNVTPFSLHNHTNIPLELHIHVTQFTLHNHASVSHLSQPHQYCIIYPSEFYSNIIPLTFKDHTPISNHSPINQYHTLHPSEPHTDITPFRNKHQCHTIHPSGPHFDMTIQKLTPISHYSSNHTISHHSQPHSNVNIHPSQPHIDITTFRTTQKYMYHHIHPQNHTDITPFKTTHQCHTIQPHANATTFTPQKYTPCHTNWPNSEIPECTCSISQNAPFRTEMCTFLFWMEHSGIWNRCILGFVKLVHCPSALHIPVCTNQTLRNHYDLPFTHPSPLHCSSVQM